MYLLVTYDVATSTPSGARRLREVAKCCQDFGQRVQNSVFECLVDESQLALLKARILNILDKTQDSVRIYKLGSNYKSKIEHLGKQTSFDIEGSLVI